LQNLEELKVKAMVHGEDNDLAIAAASVIARSYFVKKMKELSIEHKTYIPLGAGKNVVTAGKIFVREHGWENLKFAVKTHFKTMEKLR
jgi:ribonuclease HIII